MILFQQYLQQRYPFPTSYNQDLQKTMMERNDETIGLRNLTKVRARYQKVQIRKIALLCISIYAGIGVVFGWFNASANQNTWTLPEIPIFNLIYQWPNTTRLVIFLSLLFAGYPRIALVSSAIFFGECVWVFTDSQESLRMWQISVMGLTVNILFLMLSLLACYFEEEDRWQSQNADIAMMMDEDQRKQKRDLDDFIKKVEDGLIRQGS